MANRNLRCVDCGNTKWVSQSQWRKLCTDFGSSTKVKFNFRCYECKSLEKNDLFRYQLRYGKPVKQLRRNIRAAYRKYLENNDLSSLQNSINGLLSANEIPQGENIAYHTSENGKHLLGITIKNMPFVGDLYISLYTQRKGSY